MCGANVHTPIHSIKSREPDAPHQVGESWVALKVVEHWLTLQSDKRAGALLKSDLQILERLVPLPESRIDAGSQGRRDISAFRLLVQFVEHLLRFCLVARHGEGVSKPSDRYSAAVRKFDRL